MTEQVRAVCETVRVVCPDVVIEERTASPITNRFDKAVVSADLAALVRSPQEEVALAALIVAWFNDRGPPPKPSDLPQQLLALGVLGVGETIDPLKDRADRNRRWNNIQYTASDRPVATAGVATNALAFAAAAGSCSGAFVDLMHRAGGVPANAPAELRRRAMFAASLLDQLGSAIMPPDRRCVAR